MNVLAQKLQQRYPNIAFTEGDHFKWSPAHNTVTFAAIDPITDDWSLLHELGHALCGHKSYDSDIELLKKEAEAWQKAEYIAQGFNISISESHIQDCLDSYRDWVFKRSSCPACHSQGIQSAPDMYLCLNCKNTWHVTKERFCRPYRRVA